MKRTAGIFLLALALCAPTAMATAQQNKAEQMYQQALYEMEGMGNYAKAVDMFNRVVAQFPNEKSVAAKALLRVGMCQEKLGNREAQKAYERVIKDFADQREVVAEARSRLLALENASLSKKVAEQDLSQKYTSPLTRQAWAGPDVDNLGVASPDGRMLSFVDRETGDLAIRDLSTGEKRRLTNKGSWQKSYEFALKSIFSSDGKRLAYSWFNNDNFFDLRLVDSDGSGNRILIRDDKSLYFGPLDWSSDGKQILAQSEGYDYSSQLVLVSAEDGSRRILKQLGSQYPGKACFSPDGKHVVYDLPQAEGAPERDIFMLRADGSREIPLVKHPADDYVVGWAPDGKRIIFASDRAGTWDIWAVQVADTGAQGVPEIVKKDAGSLWPMGITKNGLLYYSVSTGSEDVYIAKLDFTKGIVLTQPEKFIRRSTSGNSSPTFSPDGNSIAFVSEVGPRAGGRGRRVLCIRSLKTGEERELSPKLNGINRLSWSPDGRSILVSGLNEKNQQGIYRLDVHTNEIALVRETQADENIKGRVWSPDGKAIYYTITELKKKLCRLMMREIEGGKESELYRQEAPPDFSRLCLSPDGMQLVFSTKDVKKKSSYLRIVPTKGGDSRVVLALEQEATLVPIAWASNGREILFAKLSGSRQEQTRELCRIPAEGGEPQKVPSPLPMETMSDFCIHPDGQRIAFTAGKQKTEIWVLENFLPKEKSEKSLTVRKIGTGPTVDMLGAPSPDGEYLSMTDWETGDLALYDVATGNKRRLTNKGSWAESSEHALFSQISPDGKAIAYAWYNTDNFYEMRTISTDSGNARVVFRNEEAEYIEPMQWSQDGREILAASTRKDGSSQILFVSVRNGAVRVLKTLGRGYPVNVSLSPDGRQIVYDLPVDEKDSNRDIFLLAADGSRENALINHPAADFSPMWTPDGENIIFCSDRTGSTGLWAIRVKDGKAQGSPQLIKPDMGRVVPMGFTNNGTLYYGLPVGMNDIYVAKLNAATGQIVDPPKPVSQRFVGANVVPDWSGDGKYLAYISQRDPLGFGTCTLVFHAMDTKEEREVPFTIKYPKSLHWSPDGLSLLAVGQGQKNRFGVYRIDAQNGSTTPIVMSESGRSISEPSWLPDGKRIILAVEDGNTKAMQIMIRDVSTGREQELHRSNLPARVGSLVLSRDGRQVAFSANDPATKSLIIKAVSTTDGALRELIRTEPPAMVVPLAWINDDRTLLYGKWTYRSPMDVWMVSTDGGEPQKTQLSMDGIRNLRIHPDGERIAFTAGQYKFEVWVMENFLPKEVRQK